MSGEEREAFKETLREVLIELHPPTERPKASTWSKYGGILGIVLTAMVGGGGGLAYFHGLFDLPDKTAENTANIEKTNNAIIQIDHQLSEHSSQLSSIQTSVADIKTTVGEINERLNNK